MSVSVGGKMKGYKGFKKRLVCRGKQYAENTVFEEKEAVICCAGYNSMAKAKRGSWITLAEWSYSEEKERYIPKCVKAEFVDGEQIKEDTFYKLKDGEFVEVK